jgi:hypothetical protein
MKLSVVAGGAVAAAVVYGLSRLANRYGDVDQASSIAGALTVGAIVAGFGIEWPSAPVAPPAVPPPAASGGQ